MTYRENNADQQLDIRGTLNQTDGLERTDEAQFLGRLVAGQTGVSASISGVVPNLVLTGLAGITNNSLTRFVTIEGAANPGNNGTFQIIQVISGSSVMISNAGGVSGDANNGSIEWIERQPWSAEDDHNFHRTDRAAIKGTAYDGPIPTYVRCVDQNSQVDANLFNIAGKTTDAKAFVDNLKFLDQLVSAGNTYITLSSIGDLKHADSVNITGVPVYDGYDAGNEEACFVGIIDDGYGAELTVLNTQGNAEAGWRIIGRTRAGASTSPNSVEIEFRAMAPGGDPALSEPYTWESGHAGAIHVIIGYRSCLNALSELVFRRDLINGILYGGTGSGGGTNIPAEQVGQVLFSVNGSTFEAALPVTSSQGWLVNDQGILIVNT